MCVSHHLLCKYTNTLSLLQIKSHKSLLRVYVRPYKQTFIQPNYSYDFFKLFVNNVRVVVVHECSRGSTREFGSAIHAYVTFGYLPYLQPFNYSYTLYTIVYLYIKLYTYLHIHICYSTYTHYARMRVKLSMYNMKTMCLNT